MKGIVLRAIIIILVVSALPASAGKQQPLDLATATGGGQTDRLLEKYNVYPYPTDPADRVVNPNPNIWGTWDINDQLTFQAYGSLAPSASTQTVRKIVWGYDPMHVSKRGVLAWWSFISSWYGTQVTAPSSRLTVKTCLSPQNRCFTLPATQTSQGYLYTLCTQVVYDPDDPALMLIPGSTPAVLPEGSVPGMGVPSTVTFSITNPTTRSIRDIYAGFGVSSDQGFAPGCTGIHGAEQHDYPLSWYP